MRTTFKPNSFNRGVNIPGPILCICIISGLLIRQYSVHNNEWIKGSKPFILVEGRSIKWILLKHSR